MKCYSVIFGLVLKLQQEIATACIHQRFHRVRWVVVFTCALLALFYLSPTLVVRADEGVIYVAPSGECGGESYAPCFDNIQAAVDVAGESTIIKVATGVYTGVTYRAGTKQIAYISKTLTLQGGYTTANGWLFSDPVANPTIFNAQDQGSVIYITRDVITTTPTITLTGLHITGGNSSWNSRSKGGGIHAEYSQIVIQNSFVFSNTTGNDGGGIYLKECLSAAFTGNIIEHNSAQLNGGGVYASNSEEILIRNNQFANNAAQKNYSYSSFGGGAVFILQSNHITIENNHAYKNSGGLGAGFSIIQGTNVDIGGNNSYDNSGIWGGGLAIDKSKKIVVSDNQFQGNYVGWYGGGIYVNQSHVQLNNNVVLSNTSRAYGGGIALRNSNLSSLISNTIGYNDSFHGGGVYLLESDNVLLSKNTIFGNIIQPHVHGGGAEYAYQFEGGGLYVSNSSNVLVNANKIQNNTAIDYRSYGYSPAYGGGLFLSRSSVTLSNNFITDNSSHTQGSGAYLINTKARFYHNTFANNTGGDGEGLYVTNELMPNYVFLYNNIIVRHKVGIKVVNNSFAYMRGTLWGSGDYSNGDWVNLKDWEGEVDIGATSGANVVNFWRSPVFVDAASGDYHIEQVSGARDRGVETELIDDIDGELRPMGQKPDIGADEFPDIGLQLQIGASETAVNPGRIITYVIMAKVGGTTTLSDTVLTNTLPIQQQLINVSYNRGQCNFDTGWGGALRCDLGDLYVGDTAQLTLTMQVTTLPPDVLPHPMRQTVVVKSEQTSRTAYSDVSLHDCHAQLQSDAHKWENIQAAVDASTHLTDVVKVSGICASVNTYGGEHQVVYIDKTLTIRGGYNRAFEEPPNPTIYPTRIDAQGKGRGISIVGENISPLIENVQLTGGYADGGGIYVAKASATISNCTILSNTGLYGGGVYLDQSPALFHSNTIMSNTATLYGGGLLLFSSQAKFYHNDVLSNTASNGGGFALFYSDDELDTNYISENIATNGGGVFIEGSAATLSNNTINLSTADYGGGIYLNASNAKLVGNQIVNNFATSDGGGVYLNSSEAELISNTLAANVASLYGGGGCLNRSESTLLHNNIRDNQASSGGGLALFSSAANVNANKIQANRANNGGGLYVSYSDAAIDNNFITDNLLDDDGYGSGLYITASTPQLRHNTIAYNTGGTGTGIYAENQSSVVLTNTILVRHTVGISVTDDSQASLEGTLWGAETWTNDLDWSGPLMTGTFNIWGNPAFVNYTEADYHITSDSAALDAGDYSLLSPDIDGDVRPAGFGPDIGADEIPGPSLYMQMNSSHAVRNTGDTVSYTVVLENVGNEPIEQLVITDIPPVYQHIIAASVMTGTCTVPPTTTWSSEVRCELDTLNVGDRVSLQLTAQITSTLPHTLEPIRVQHTVQATGPAIFHYIQEDGIALEDCHVRLNDDATEWANIQDAIDASTHPTDVVKVAGSICLGGVRIDKSLTLQGGYAHTPPDWDNPDHLSNPTTLNALRQSRVVFVRRPYDGDAITATIAGLRITGGKASHDGGGISVFAHVIRIINNTIIDNKVDNGTGVVIYGSEECQATIRNGHR